MAVDKSLLAKLRKQTGFSIANCRKALDENNNDFEQVSFLLSFTLFCKS